MLEVDPVEILISPDASHLVCFRAAGAPLVLNRLPDGTYGRVAFPQDFPDSSSKDGIVSPDGQWLAYAAIPQGTPPASKNGNVGFRVYLLDLQKGERTEIPGRLRGLNSNGDSDGPSFSPDGRWVAFRTSAGDWAPDDDNDADDIAVFDRRTGLTRLVTRNSQTRVPWDLGSYRARFGTRPGELWVATRSAGVLAGDLNQAADFVRMFLPEDVDGDGLEDAWETSALGGLDGTGEEDSDRDGVSNREEFAAGTDPRSADSFLQLRLLEESPGTWVAEWSSVPGRRYRVETLYTLNGSWVATGPVVTATGPVTRYGLPPLLSDVDTYVRLLLAD